MRNWSESVHELGLEQSFKSCFILPDDPGKEINE